MVRLIVRGAAHAARTHAALALVLTAVAAPPAVLLPVGDAIAKDKDKKDTEESDLDLEALKKDLDSGKEATILAALSTIEKSKDEKAATLVDGLLHRGGTVKVLEAALDAVAKLKAPASSKAVSPYVWHRNDKVRRKAVRSLLKTGGPVAVQSLRRALRSNDAMVRGTAATGLGTLGAREALDDLFKAFDHNVGEAAASIGQLCEPKQCDQFSERLGKTPFDIMSSGFDQILFRPEKEMPEEQKLRVIGRLRELGTAEVGKYLADVAERWPADWSKKIKQSLDAAAKATGAGG